MRELDPEFLLTAYANGIFPMADQRGVIHWLAPDPRAILPLEGFRTTRSLRAAVRQQRFRCTINTAFEDVVRACADREVGTWISDEIFRAYRELHRLGFAHSVECWAGEELAGGLYGVSIAGAFFGESMFFRRTDASKVALVHLVERMRQRGMSLLDIQFTTPHLLKFGAIEIERQEYERRLWEAVRAPVSFIDGTPRVEWRMTNHE